MNHLELEFANIEAETQVIGSLLLETRLSEKLIIEPGQLYDSRHNNILYIIKKLIEKDITPEALSIVEYAAEKGKVDKIGGMRYITELASSVPTTSNFDHYQNLILEKYQKRKIYEAAQSMLKDIIDLSPSEVRTKYLNELEVLDIGSKKETKIKSIKDVLHEVYEDANTVKGERPGANTGFVDLNRITGGYQATDLVIVGARPSAGKTAFVLNSAIEVAKDDLSLVFSAEMPTLLLGKRMVSTAANINGQKMRNPMRDFTQEDWDRFSHGIGDLSDKNIYFYEEDIDVPIIEKVTREVYAKKKEGQKMVVFIDYLQIIRMDKKWANDRNKGMGDVANNLKKLAKKLGITIVLLSQLSRKVEERQDKRPMMSDLRESGELEQIADIITFLYREEYYDRETDKKGIVELIIGKHRNGEVGTVYLGFRKEFSKFINITV